MTKPWIFFWDRSQELNDVLLSTAVYFFLHRKAGLDESRFLLFDHKFDRAVIRSHDVCVDVGTDEALLEFF